MAEQSKSTPGTYGESFGDSFQWHLLAVAARHPSGVIRFRSAFDHTYFTSDAQRVIAKALLSHVDKYKTLPTKSLLVEDAKLHSGKELVDKLDKHVAAMFADDVSDALPVLDKCVEFGRLRAVVNACLKAADDIDKGDTSTVMELVQKALHVGEDILDVGIDFVEADRSKWYSESSDMEDRVPTGMSHVDRMLGGGGVRGGLYLYLAPPKRGKTTALVNTGFGPLLSLDELTVVHISNEINAKRTAIRYDARLAGKYFPLRKKDPAKYAAIMQERAKHFLKGRLFIKSWPTRTCGVSNIRSYLSMLGGYDIKPDVLIVDYADIMRAERRIGDMRHEQAGIYEDLRGLAGEYDCVCWTASQAKQSALDKDTPDMRDFAESFEKAAVMDGGLAICQTTDESIEGRGRFFAIGLRDEQDQSTVEFKIDRSKCLIQTTGLYDQALMRVVTPEDDPDAEDVQMQATPVGKPKEEKTAYKKGGNKPAIVTQKISKAIVPPAPPLIKVPVKKPVPLVAAMPVIKTAVKKGLQHATT